MPIIHRQRQYKKLPILVLVILMCVQSVGYASHGLSLKLPEQAQPAERSMPPCHDMPDMQADDASMDHENRVATMPCCDDGNCSDADCMMPAGIHFPALVQTFFIPVSGDVFIADTRSTDAVKASPPIRPPIA